MHVQKSIVYLTPSSTLCIFKSLEWSSRQPLGPEMDGAVQRRRDQFRSPDVAYYEFTRRVRVFFKNQFDLFYIPLFLVAY